MNPNDNKNNKNNKPGGNWRGVASLVGWALLLTIIFSYASSVIGSTGRQASSINVEYGEFQEMVESGQVARVEFDNAEDILLITPEEDGWYSPQVGMTLKQEGYNVVTMYYGDFSSNLEVYANPAPETQPAAPETQPAAPETQPTVPETQPSQPTGSIRVTNVALSSDLTQYTLNLCSQYGVDSSVIFSVMYHESHFNAGATSGSGAQGLMQILPRYSASRMAKLGVTNLYDPASNILVGIDLLAEYYHTYGSWNQALTAYRTGNAGNDSAYAATILGSVGMFQTVYYE